jgi:hypothetical protein
LPTLLLRFMPAGKAIPPFDRQWLALVLTSQVFVGAFLGIAAQAFLAIVVIFHILPWFGLELLDTARAAVEFDLPARGMRLFWGGPECAWRARRNSLATAQKAVAAPPALTAAELTGSLPGRLS